MQESQDNKGANPVEGNISKMTNEQVVKKNNVEQVENGGKAQAQNAEVAEPAKEKEKDAQGDSDIFCTTVLPVSRTIAYKELKNYQLVGPAKPELQFNYSWKDFSSAEMRSISEAIYGDVNKQKAARKLLNELRQPISCDRDTLEALGLNQSESLDFMTIMRKEHSVDNERRKNPNTKPSQEEIDAMRRMDFYLKKIEDEEIKVPSDKPNLQKVRLTLLAHLGTVNNNRQMNWLKEYNNIANAKGYNKAPDIKIGSQRLQRGEEVRVEYLPPRVDTRLNRVRSAVRMGVKIAVTLVVAFYMAPLLISAALILAPAVAGIQAVFVGAALYGSYSLAKYGVLALTGDELFSEVKSYRTTQAERKAIANERPVTQGKQQNTRSTELEELNNKLEQKEKVQVKVLNDLYSKDTSRALSKESIQQLRNTVQGLALDKISAARKNELLKLLQSHPNSLGDKQYDKKEFKNIKNIIQKEAQQIKEQEAMLEPQEKQEKLEYMKALCENYQEAAKKLLNTLQGNKTEEVAEKAEKAGLTDLKKFLDAELKNYESQLSKLNTANVAQDAKQEQVKPQQEQQQPQVKQPDVAQVEKQQADKIPNAAEFSLKDKIQIEAKPKSKDDTDIKKPDKFNLTEERKKFKQDMKKSYVKKLQQEKVHNSKNNISSMSI